MMNAAAGIFLAARRKPKLPYDAEVEYLESTGRQWIDTDIRPAQDLSFVVKFDNLNVDIGYGNVFGSRLSSNNNEYQVTCYNNGSVGVGTRYGNLGFSTNAINIISYDGSSELNINGTVRRIVPQSCESANGNIVLFGISQKGVVFQLSNCRIYNAKFGSARDMIPVRFTNELGQSEGAMYDRANPTVGMNPDGSPRTDGLYRNRGTGAFVIGPDKTA